MQRCAWVKADNLEIEYHDQEWGVPVFDDQRLFESLLLENAQAGLSWSTILRKRENYRRAFAGFNPQTTILNNNIISNLDEPFVQVAPAPLLASNNSFFTLVASPTNSTLPSWQANFSINPQLTESNGRLVAGPGSSLIDNGLSTEQVPDFDVFGIGRNAPDIGAVEYQ